MIPNSLMIVEREGFTPEWYTEAKLNELLAQDNAVIAQKDVYGQPTLIIVQELTGAETYKVRYR